MINSGGDTGAQTVAIVTLPGFNEIDTFVATRMIDSAPGLSVVLVGPDASAVSMAGVEVATPGKLGDLHHHAAVLIGSGLRTFEHIENDSMMNEFSFADSGDQLVGSQCSGAAILHRLGLVDGITVCTDLTTTPKLRALGVLVANESFRFTENLATAGGCLSSAYLAFWTVARLVGRQEAIAAIEYVAPIGEAGAYVERATALTLQAASVDS